MRLLTVGDSFTYGEELVELTSAWPNVLSDKLGYKLTNLAKPGSGNTRMIRHCAEQLDNYDLVIIAWSHFARIEMADKNGFYDLWPGCSSMPHKEYSPWRHEIIEYYNRNHNDDYLYRQYLINIILLQKYLSSINKQYLMLDAFGNHQYLGRTDIKNKNLLDQIDPLYFIGWPNESMVEWTWGTKQGSGNHFLEDGHIKVAEKIYQYMEKLSWLS